MGHLRPGSKPWQSAGTFFFRKRSGWPGPFFLKKKNWARPTVHEIGSGAIRADLGVESIGEKSGSESVFMINY